MNNTNDNKNRTYPKTTTRTGSNTTSGDFTVTSSGVYYPTTTQRRENKFKRFLKFIFVKNIEIKLLAIGASVVMFVIAAGLAGLAG
ncbi:MAG: hypothetical protein FWC11_05255 [Firmicutes bacterium]|nr:hypothetical protein [Bacillota bacterium]